MGRVHTIFFAITLLLLLTLTAAGADENAVRVTLDGALLEIGEHTSELQSLSC